MHSKTFYWRCLENNTVPTFPIVRDIEEKELCHWLGLEDTCCYCLANKGEREGESVCVLVCVHVRVHVCVRVRVCVRVMVRVCVWERERYKEDTCHVGHTELLNENEEKEWRNGITEKDTKTEVT